MIAFTSEQVGYYAMQYDFLVWTTVDGGTTWSWLGSVPDTIVELHAVDNTVVCLSPTSIYVSVDGGSFQESSISGSTFSPEDLSVPSTKLMTGIGGDHKNQVVLARSSDGGNTFVTSPIKGVGFVSSLSSPTVSTVYLTSVIQTGNGLRGGSDQQVPVILKSTDAGASFQHVYKPNNPDSSLFSITCGTADQCCVPAANTSRAGSGYEIVCTTDGGASWNTAGLAIANTATSLSRPAYVRGDGDHVSFAAGQGELGSFGFVYFSSDGGATFESQTIDGWQPVSVTRPTMDVSFMLATRSGSQGEVEVQIYRREA